MSRAQRLATASFWRHHATVTVTDVTVTGVTVAPLTPGWPLRAVTRVRAQSQALAARWVTAWPASPTLYVAADRIALTFEPARGCYERARINLIRTSHSPTL